MFLFTTQIGLNLLQDECHQNLLSLMKTGMGILHWTQRASTTLKIHMVDLMKFMATKRHYLTNRFMLEMMRDFITPSKNQYSWPWARLFLDGALEVSAKSNMDYTFVMVSIVAGNAPDSVLWGIGSLNCDGAPEKKRRAILTGRIIQDLIVGNDGETAESPVARALWQKIECPLRN